MYNIVNGRVGIKRDASTLLKLLKEYDILSVKAHRKTKKVFKKKLKEKDISKIKNGIPSLKT